MTRQLLLCVGLLAMAAAMALTSSNNVKEQEDQLAQITRDIAAEQDRIRVLTAEWHTLKTPERLEALTSRHLPTLHPATPKQIASLSDLLDPLPAAAEAPVAVAATEEKPVEVAATQVNPPVVREATPTARATLARTPVARVAPPQPTRVAAARPARTPAAAPRSIETVIAQTENPFRSAVSAERDEPRRVNDELSELIERQPSEGILWASAGGRE